MLHPELINDLCCPETKQRVHLADPTLIASLSGTLAADPLTLPTSSMRSADLRSRTSVAQRWLSSGSGGPAMRWHAPS